MTLVNLLGYILRWHKHKDRRLEIGPVIPDPSIFEYYFVLDGASLISFGFRVVQYYLREIVAISGR